MAKAKGPILCLSASGKFGNLFEVRATDSGHQIIPIRRKPEGRSAAQQAQTNRFQVAIGAWKELTPEQKDAWNQAAQGTGMIGYRLYLSEYLGQGIQTPDQPLLP